MANATIWSNSTGNTGNSGVSLDNTRRVFNFGDRVAELAPMQSPFFVYLSKVAKKATNDPVFKFLEQRHQWQRRNFEFTTSFTAAEEYADTEVFNATQDLVFSCKYDEYGKIVSASECTFLLPGQILALKADDGEVYNVKISESAVVTSSASTGADAANIAHETDDNRTSIAGEMISVVGKVIPNGTVFSAGNKGQVVG